MSLQFLTFDDVQVANKRILIREDFNVPIKDGIVQSDLRIRAALPGIQLALAANGQVILMSHLGRPEAGTWNAEYSLQPVAKCLEDLLSMPVRFVQDWFTPEAIADQEIIMLENVRFLKGETKNSPALAKKMADLCDIFVMDAFGSAHRAHASTVGVVEFAPIAIGGPLLVEEVTALDQVMHNPRSPVVAIIGGAKVSTKLSVLKNLLSIVDVLIVGGGMANTLLAALGNSVGESLYEQDLIPAAKELLNLAQQQKCEILLPIDTVMHNNAIVDIGDKTIQLYTERIKHAATILWNGPLGVFEDQRFAKGTEQIALAIAHSKAFSVAGGGDTLAAIDGLHLADQFSYISTGGGAFLEYIEGIPLPAITALINKSKHCVKTN